MRLGMLYFGVAFTIMGGDLCCMLLWSCPITFI